MVTEVTFTDLKAKKTDKLNPVVICFQNGEPIKEKLPQFQVDLKSAGPSTNINVTISGQEYIKSRQTNDSLQSNYIAVCNRTTQKVRLIEVDFAILCNKTLMKTEDMNIVVPTDKKNQVAELQRKFGGKRAVHQLLRREKLNFDASNAEEELRAAVAGVDVSEPIEPKSHAENESFIKILPPCHRDANDPREVYLLPEIFTPEELSSVSELVDKLLEDQHLESYSNFFKVCVNQAKEIKPHLKKRVAALLFMNALIDFLKLPARKLTVKSLNLCEYSSLFHKKIIDEFCITSNSSVTRPTTIRDKAVCHILVLSLICCQYEVNIQELAVLVKVPIKKMAQLANAVGASPSPGGQYKYVLKTPLPAIPKLSARRRR